MERSSAWTVPYGSNKILHFYLNPLSHISRKFLIGDLSVVSPGAITLQSASSSATPSKLGGIAPEWRATLGGRGAAES